MSPSSPLAGGLSRVDIDELQERLLGVQARGDKPAGFDPPPIGQLDVIARPPQSKMRKKSTPVSTSPPCSRISATSASASLAEPQAHLGLVRAGQHRRDAVAEPFEPQIDLAAQPVEEQEARTNSVVLELTLYELQR